ncbi:MAG: amidohydrolase family protein [Gemmatimonadetes bacterium]|nr:amidohydrolase family protein [Gemmatimonadota bacterium]
MRMRPRGWHGLAAIGLIALTACQKTTRYDLVIANGRVMDPASGVDSTLHLGIVGDSIAALSAKPLAGLDTIDASGLVVAPGFIDLHAHGQTRGDMGIQAQDGVTTALDMEAGVFPVAKWYASRTGQAPINYGATVGHRPARFFVFHGVEVLHGATNPTAITGLGPLPAGANQAASPAQIESLEGVIRQGLDEGGLGVGFGINYSPAASAEEITRLFAVAAGRGVPVFVHTRAFGLEPIREAVVTAKATGAALHLVHVGSSSLGDLPAALTLLDSARAAGQDVTTEVYPYTAGSTRLESAMFNPGWQRNLRLDYGDLAWPLTGERLTRASFEPLPPSGGLGGHPHDERGECRQGDRPSGGDDRERRCPVRRWHGPSPRSRYLRPHPRPIRAGAARSGAHGRSLTDDHPAGPSPRAPRPDDGQERTDRGRRRCRSHPLRSGYRGGSVDIRSADPHLDGYPTRARRGELRRARWTFGVGGAARPGGSSAVGPTVAWPGSPLARLPSRSRPVRR